ncbi:MAG: energy transducer TonB [Pacificimonas sp.]|jgi:protein TonB|nr:energy transducer TonB [Pacificimonas sp.]
MTTESPFQPTLAASRFTAFCMTALLHLVAALLVLSWLSVRETSPQQVSLGIATSAVSAASETEPQPEPTFVEQPLAADLAPPDIELLPDEDTAPPPEPDAEGFLPGDYSVLGDFSFDDRMISGDRFLTGPDGAAGAPVSGTTAATLTADALSRFMPPYPEEARQAGEEGTVLLLLSISAEGSVTDVAVARSSGSPRLDAAARRHARDVWRFIPAMKTGVPAASVREIAVRFALDAD